MILPASLVADLYRNDLIEEGLNTTAAPAGKKLPAAEKPLQYLGSNVKNVVLLVNYENNVYLPETQLTFLTNILLACKLNLADVAIVNYNKQRPSLETLVNTLKPNCLIVFGIPGFDSSLAGITEFNVQQTNAGAIILSPNLESLNNASQEGKLLKSKLWLCLKQFFNV